MLTVHYHMKPEDIGAFGVSACVRSGQMRKGQTFLASLHVLGFFVLGMLFATMQSSLPRFIATIVAFTMFGTLFGLVAWQNYPRSLQKNMMKVENPKLGRSMFGDFSLTITENDFAIDHELAFSRTKWAAVRELVETPTHLFLMLSPVRGYVIPKTSLRGATPAELSAEFEKHIAARAHPDGEPDSAWSQALPKRES